MSGLLFLTSEDFFIKGDNLCSNIQGISLILFYSTQCIHCKCLTPIFKSLPGTIGGCQFGMINVSNSKSCVKMSRETLSPITYVPYIILYINGSPFMRYNGPAEQSEIQRFVLEVANKIQTKQKFTEEIITKNISKEIPPYTIGHPVCNDNVCYLEFEDAYIKKK